MIKSRCINQLHWLGLQNYKEIEDQQKQLVPKIFGTDQVVILGTEFFPVLTLGVRGNISEDLFLSEKDLALRGLEILKTDRGGQATIHSPGQLVIYPMLDLKMHRMGMRNFVCQIMKVTLRTLESLGIKAFYSAADPGIYTDHGKLAFCGLKSDHGVIRHGLSINIKNDLSLFDGIRSCGHSQPRLDQVSRYHSIEPALFFQSWGSYFQQDFYLSVPDSIGMNR